MKNISTNKLWNRNFSLLIIGQVISIFGNMVLTFALPLYILYISDSPALFGLVLGLSNIPLLIMSPVGGIVADRFKKQRIMFWLDTITTVVIVAYIAFSGFFANIVPIIVVKLMALNAIQGMYMPAVQASLPLLLTEKKLVSGNAVVNLVNSFSNMGGMAVAGVLFAHFGLMPILVVSAICFGVTTIIDMILHVPYKEQDTTGSVASIIKSDMTLAASFMIRTKPVIAVCAVVAFMFSLTLMSMILVGIPVLITQHLDMTMDFVGISQSVMMGGGLVGGILAGVLGDRLKFEKMHILLTGAGLSVIPIGIALLIGAPPFATYLIITATSALAFIIVIPANVLIMAFIQAETPTELTGKVMSLLVVMPFLANALGQLIFGVLFEWFAHMPYVVVFGAVAMTVLTGMYTKVKLRVK